jgi:hypothetical protein
MPLVMWLLQSTTNGLVDIGKGNYTESTNW